jgi:hypothetical protein
MNNAPPLRAPHFVQRRARGGCVLEHVFHRDERELPVCEWQGIECARRGAKSLCPAGFDRVAAEIHACRQQAEFAGRCQCIAYRATDIEQRPGLCMIQRVENLVAGFLDAAARAARVATPLFACAEVTALIELCSGRIRLLGALVDQTASAAHPGELRVGSKRMCLLRIAERTGREDNYLRAWRSISRYGWRSGERLRHFCDCKVSELRCER